MMKNYSIISWSPGWRIFGWIVPAGNSITQTALKYTRVIRKGTKEEMASIILLFLSTNKTSIGKRIKKVWTELQGFNIKAWPALNSCLPKRPFNLLKTVPAIIASPETTVFLV